MQVEWSKRELNSQNQIKWSKYEMSPLRFLFFGLLVQKIWLTFTIRPKKTRWSCPLSGFCYSNSGLGSVLGLEQDKRKNSQNLIWASKWVS